MAKQRDLAPDEAALWAKVIASVRPLSPIRPPAPAPVAPSPPAAAPAAPVAIARARAMKGRVPPPRASAAPPPPPTPATLDASWDRRLARGTVSPESAVDLHGHSLASAYDRLDFGLEQAIARGDRVLLLVTGKAPRPESERPHARGAIRAAVGDWLAASRHSERIAAVRPAHPRHGGAGALYIVLRRQRNSGTRIS